MNKSIKTKWVKALRSGKYKQTTGTLREVGHTTKGKEVSTFCCLGVLCDLHLKSGVGKMKWDSSRYGRGSGGILPNTVAKWAGLNSPDPLVKDVALSQWNDNEGASFKKIATLIEKHL